MQYTLPLSFFEFDPMDFPYYHTRSHGCFKVGHIYDVRTLFSSALSFEPIFLKTSRGPGEPAAARTMQISTIEFVAVRATIMVRHAKSYASFPP